MQTINISELIVMDSNGLKAFCNDLLALHLLFLKGKLKIKDAESEFIFDSENDLKPQIINFMDNTTMIDRNATAMYRQRNHEWDRLGEQVHLFD